MTQHAFGATQHDALGPALGNPPNVVALVRRSELTVHFLYYFGLVTQSSSAKKEFYS
jgi:hypothetical protein